MTHRSFKKFEKRNPKSETNSKLEIENESGSDLFGIYSLRILDLFRISRFGFRIFPVVVGPRR